ncbi:hypothetical protein J437_LFUL007353 [Ladona fulva]|uniref:Uncharacterized protein n=1 Tax=Ladona fulva TaxID=123851 RepID=A0A8K0KKZ7_LADFU|nr:hypothetical protein J437_LFUL007353 [Ladona fulva]
MVFKREEQEGNDSLNLTPMNKSLDNTLGDNSLGKNASTLSSSGLPADAANDKESNGDKAKEKKDSSSSSSVKMKTDDLFTAHDFDIKIDLEVPLPNNPVSVTPKPMNPVKDTGPRRSLNLEDYKKKRGLI